MPLHRVTSIWQCRSLPKGSTSARAKKPSNDPVSDSHCIHHEPRLCVSDETAGLLMPNLGTGLASGLRRWMGVCDGGSREGPVGGGGVPC